MDSIAVLHIALQYMVPRTLADAHRTAQEANLAQERAQTSTEDARARCLETQRTASQYIHSLYDDMDHMYTTADFQNKQIQDLYEDIKELEQELDTKEYQIRQLRQSRPRSYRKG